MPTPDINTLLGGYGAQLKEALALAGNGTPEGDALATALDLAALMSTSRVVTLSSAPVDAVAATDTITSNNTQVTAGDTVTVNGKVYTFRESPTVEGDVHFVTNADTSLGNLAAAINHTGTPNTDYKCAAAHPTVSSSSVASHVLTLTALIKGVAGNALTLTKSAATLAVGGATFSGGIDGTLGTTGRSGIFDGQLYVCLTDATISTSGAWVAIPLGGGGSFSGAYADLTGKPTLGTAADNAETDFATAAQGTKADAAMPSANLSAALAALEPAGHVWRLRSGVTGYWTKVAYGGGVFVAISGQDPARVMTSSNGIDWTVQTAAEDNTWADVAYGAGLFVAVASDGTHRVMTSPDGVTWTTRSASQAKSWVAIEYGGDVFVAMATGSGRAVMTSADGIAWTSQSGLGTANNFLNLAYGDGTFVATASTGASQIVISTDGGETWSPQDASDPYSWYGVAYGAGLFVSVASSGGNEQVMTSPDGITWTARTTPDSLADAAWFDVAYGNGLFVAIANYSDLVMTSPDGINWTARSATTAVDWTAIEFGGGVFVAVNDSGGVYPAMTSTADNPFASAFEGVKAQTSIQSLVPADGSLTVNTANPANPTVAVNPSSIIFPDSDPHAAGAGYWVAGVLTKSAG